MTTTRKVFLSCSPGFERLLADETNQLLKAKQTNISIKLEVGGVEIDSLTDQQIWQLCHTSLLAESVRIRVGPEGHRIRFKGEFISHLKKLPFHAFLNELSRPTVKVICHKSKLYHSDMLREMIEDYFVRRFSPGQKKSINNNNSNENNNNNNNPSSSDDLDLIDENEVVEDVSLDDLLLDDGDEQTRKIKQQQVPYQIEGADRSQTVYALMDNNRAQLSISAGSFLHRRTPNKYVVDGMLRETIAAAIIRCVAPEIPLDGIVWDPFCGSGTILSEFRRFELQCQTTQLSQQPISRTFEFEKWRTHDQAAYEKWKKSKYWDETENKAPLINGTILRKLIGTDYDNRAITTASHNVRSSFGGLPLRHKMVLEKKDFQDAFDKLLSQATAKVTIVSNLPYGHRLNKNKSEESLRNFTTFLESQSPTSMPKIRNVFVLAGTESKFQSMSSKLNWQTMATFTNRGLPVKLLKLLLK